MAVGSPYSGDIPVRRYLRENRMIAVAALVFCFAVLLLTTPLARWFAPALGIAPDSSILIYAPIVLIMIGGLVLDSVRDSQARLLGVGLN
jgi:hypothetical protein